jgi:hypothetical protein
MRDRPRLLLNARVSTSVSARPQATIEIRNAGYRPTTVREVGFYAKETRFQTRRDGQDHLHGIAQITFKAAEGVFLEAGEAKSFPNNPDIFQWDLHADFPLRLYAVNITGRRVWGNALPVVRMLVGDDPPLADGDPDSMKRAFASHDETIYPAQVEPAWKLWKRRELRNPKAWRP